MEEDAVDWMDEVRARRGRGNQVLFAKDSAYLQELRWLFREQDHRVMVLWAFDFAEESIRRLEARYPGETRPREALDAARAWAEGGIKMRLAQQRILACHAFAKEIDRREDIAICHAIGQACAVVHTAGHAIGYPIYDLTAVIYEYGMEHCREMVAARMQAYLERLLYWREHWMEDDRAWAAFLCR